MSGHAPTIAKGISNVMPNESWDGRLVSQAQISANKLLGRDRPSASLPDFLPGFAFTEPVDENTRPEVITTNMISEPEGGSQTKDSMSKRNSAGQLRVSSMKQKMDQQDQTSLSREASGGAPLAQQAGNNGTGRSLSSHNYKNATPTTPKSGHGIRHNPAASCRTNLFEPQPPLPVMEFYHFPEEEDTLSSPLAGVPSCFSNSSHESTKEEASAPREGPRLSGAAGGRLSGRVGSSSQNPRTPTLSYSHHPNQNHQNHNEATTGNSTNGMSCAPSVVDPIAEGGSVPKEGNGLLLMNLKPRAGKPRVGRAGADTSKAAIAALTKDLQLLSKFSAIDEPPKAAMRDNNNLLQLPQQHAAPAKSSHSSQGISGLAMMQQNGGGAGSNAPPVGRLPFRSRSAGGTGGGSAAGGASGSTASGIPVLTSSGVSPRCSKICGGTGRSVSPHRHFHLSQQLSQQQASSNSNPPSPVSKGGFSTSHPPLRRPASQEGLASAGGFGPDGDQPASSGGAGVMARVNLIHPDGTYRPLPVTNVFPTFKASSHPRSASLHTGGTDPDGGGCVEASPQRPGSLQVPRSVLANFPGCGSGSSPSKAELNFPGRFPSSSTSSSGCKVPYSTPTPNPTASVSSSTSSGVHRSSITSSQCKRNTVMSSFLAPHCNSTTAGSGIGVGATAAALGGGGMKHCSYSLPTNLTNSGSNSSLSTSGSSSSCSGNNPSSGAGSGVAAHHSGSHLSHSHNPQQQQQQQVFTPSRGPAPPPQAFPGSCNTTSRGEGVSTNTNILKFSTAGVLSGASPFIASSAPAKPQRRGYAS